MAVRLNGIDIPKKVLGNEWDELVGHLVFIEQYAEGIEVPYWNTMGRLLSISPEGMLKFDRKNGSTYRIHVDDIKSMRQFVSKSRAN
jgi:hypothetical protein